MALYFFVGLYLLIIASGIYTFIWAIRLELVLEAVIAFLITTLMSGILWWDLSQYLGRQV